MATVILMCGDCHGEFDHLQQAARMAEHAGYRVGGLVLLGDVLDRTHEHIAPLEDHLKTIEDRIAAPIWLIHGNHETDAETTWRSMLTAQHRNISGRAVTIAGVTVAGMGGVFRHQIWHPRTRPAPCFMSFTDYAADLAERQGLSRRMEKREAASGRASTNRLSALCDPVRNGQLRKHASSIFPDTVERLASLRADVFVSHEAPGCGLHPFGFDDIAELTQAIGARVSFHGHHHDRRDAAYAEHAARLGFRAHGVGLCGVTSLVVPTLEAILLI